MVGDDHSHPQALGQKGFLHGGDARVHRHHQAAAILRQLADGPGVQAVALVHPVGDIILTLRSPGAEVPDQNGCGGDAVHIVVPIDCNFLSPPDGFLQSGHGLVHIRQQKGISQPIQRSVQKPGSILSTKSPGSQHLSCQMRKPQLRFQAPGLLRAGRGDIPLFSSHSRSPF